MRAGARRHRLGDRGAAASRRHGAPPRHRAGAARGAAGDDSRPGPRPPPRPSPARCSRRTSTRRPTSISARAATRSRSPDSASSCGAIPTTSSPAAPSTGSVRPISRWRADITDSSQGDKATESLEQAVQEFKKVLANYPRADKVPTALYKEALALIDLKQPALAQAACSISSTTSRAPKKPTSPANASPP